MLEIDSPLEELEQKLLSYESFKKIVQQYLSRLLGSDQDTLSIVAEMLEAVKSLSSTQPLTKEPHDIQRVVELRREALYRYGGVATVTDHDAPPLLKGGTVKIDDPQVYGMSLICTWLDCIVSNPEQSLDSLRKVFLESNDLWEAELNRIFHVNLAQEEPVVNAAAWLKELVGDAPVSSLHLSRISNLSQALGLESPQSAGEVPLSLWLHLLETRPVYDLTARFAPAGSRPDMRWIALRREGRDAPAIPTLHLVTIDRPPQHAPLPKPISLGDLQAMLECTLATPIQLEMVDRADQLHGDAPATFSASLPLGSIMDSFSLILNSPPGLVLHDLTPPGTPPAERLLRVASARAPRRDARIFRLRPLPRDAWPSQEGWGRRYRFNDLADIGVQTCPPEAYLDVLLRDSGEYDAGIGEVYFHRWGEEGISLRISAAGLRRAAQTGTLILLHADEESARAILSYLQGLIGPAAQEIDPVISQLDCQVRWRHQQGPELFE